MSLFIHEIYILVYDQLYILLYYYTILLLIFLNS